jgi:hypothetical protein
MKPNLFRELTAALLVATLLLQSATAAAPGWWSTQGLVIPQRPADDHAVLNQGQLKNFVRAAVYELHAKLPGGAGNLLNNLLHTWRTQKLNAQDYAVVTVGQLKAVAKPVYESMQAAGLPLPVPWTSLTADDDDHAVANIGQAKMVFAFVVPDIVTLGMLDSDGDGFSDALELALGTNPYLASSHPGGIGDVSGGGGTSGGGSGGGGAGGGGLPPYVDPYPEPWPDFDAAAQEDADKDSDNDGVKDAEDAVWYDPKFKHKRSGMPHYNIVDLGKCEGGFIDMADSGALVWQENALDYFDPPSLRVWTPEHPGDVNGPRQIIWDPYDFGLEDGINGWTPETISNEGKLAGRAGQIVEGLSSSRLRHYLYDPEGGSTSWLANPFPDEGSFQWTTWLHFKTCFGPGGRVFGAVDYDIYPDDNSDLRENWTAFFRLSPDDAILDDKALLSDLPPLPEDLPGEGEPLGTREPLDGDGHADLRFDPTYYGHSGTGVLQASWHARFKVYKKVYWGDPYYSYGEYDYWGYDYDREGDYGPRINLEEIWTYQLATATGTHVLMTQDTVAETHGIYHFFESVSPADHPWVSYSVNEYETKDPWSTYLGTKAYIFKPDENGTNYQPCAIYAGSKDYEADKPIKSIGLLTAQNQAIVYGDFDPENAEDWDTGLWADGEVQLIDKVISGYERYIHDPADWAHQWQFNDVSRDGMIAATAWKQGTNGLEQRMLLLIPFTTHEIKEDGTLAASGGGVQASLPSPVFCDSVAVDGTPVNDAFCELRNPRVLADGSLVGDVFVSGAIHSKACDFVKGAKGQITEAQFWVNGADTPHSVVSINPSKQENGQPERPYPFKGTFETTIQNVPLVEGANHFKLTAEDEVYHLPGYSTWSASVSVTDPTEDDTGGSGGGGNPEGVFVLQVQFAGPTLATDDADSANVGLNLDGIIWNNQVFTETAAASGVFTASLSDGRPARLTLVNVGTLSTMTADALQATLLLGDPGNSVAYQVGVWESAPDSGQFTGGYVSDGAATGSGGSTDGGSASGSGTTNTGGTTGDGGDNDGGGGAGGGNNNGGANNGGAPLVPGPIVAIDRYAGLVEKSNGGEYYRYAIGVGIPEELLAHFSMSINEEDYHVLKDEDSGLIVLRSIDRPAPLGVSFAQKTTPPPSESDLEHQKRMKEMKDKSWIAGFGCGVGFSAWDLVTEAGEMVAGTAKFLGNGAMGVVLSIRWGAEWMVGADTADTEKLIVSYSQQPSEVVEGGVGVAKFLWTLFKDTGANYPKVLTGLMTSDPELIKTALHGSEAHQAIFMMISEALTKTMEEMDTGTPGERGYVAGRIFSGAAGVVLSATKAKTLAQLSTVEVLAKVKNLKVVQAATRMMLSAKEAFLAQTKMCFEAGVPVKLDDDGSHIGIEQVRADMDVWSRDEHTGKECRKRVVQTFTTHPTELYRLAYQVRGPPESETGCHPVVSGTTESLGVTAPHPFWVSNREIPGFIATEDLRVGDVLFISGGREAVVTRKVLEHAPPGETFTTYNFEVEDYHTYFVGEAEVWVHNQSKKTHCEKIASLYAIYRRNAAAQNETPFQTLVRLQVDLMEKSKAMGLSPEKIPANIWGRAAADVTQEMLDNYLTLTDIPSFATWRQQFFSDLGAGGFFKKQIAQGGVDIHHVVEAYIQRLLKIDKILTDTCPGAPLPRNKVVLDQLNEGFDPANQLKAIHKGMDNGGISGILQSQIPVKTTMSPQEIIVELRKIYMHPSRPELHNLWPPARDWLRDLQQHGFLDINLNIPR